MRKIYWFLFLFILIPIVYVWRFSSDSLIEGNIDSALLVMVAIFAIILPRLLRSYRHYTGGSHQDYIKTDKCYNCNHDKKEHNGPNKRCVTLVGSLNSQQCSCKKFIRKR